MRYKNQSTSGQSGGPIKIRCIYPDGDSDEFCFAIHISAHLKYGIGTMITKPIYQWIEETCVNDNDNDEDSNALLPVADRVLNLCTDLNECLEENFYKFTDNELLSVFCRIITPIQSQLHELYFEKIDFDFKGKTRRWFLFVACI